MPVYPLIFEPLAKTGDYPHMAKHDGRLWERFLDAYSPLFEGVAYDVAVGGVVFSDTGNAPAMDLAWQYSTAMKIDAVLRGQGVTWAVEVRPYARAGSLGNALCYAEMLSRELELTEEVVAAVVTDETNPDVRYCAEQLGVTLFEVGRELPPSATEQLTDQRIQPGEAPE